MLFLQSIYSVVMLVYQRDLMRTCMRTSINVAIVHVQSDATACCFLISKPQHWHINVALTFTVNKGTHHTIPTVQLHKNVVCIDALLFACCEWFFFYVVRRHNQKHHIWFRYNWRGTSRWICYSIVQYMFYVSSR